MTDREQLIEKLAEFLFKDGYIVAKEWGEVTTETKVYWRGKANRLLQQVQTPSLRLTIVRKEAKWPENPYQEIEIYKSIDDMLNDIYYDGYQEAQQAMFSAGAMMEVKE